MQGADGFVGLPEGSMRLLGHPTGLGPAGGDGKAMEGTGEHNHQKRRRATSLFVPSYPAL